MINLVFFCLYFLLGVLVLVVISAQSDITKGIAPIVVVALWPIFPLAMAICWLDRCLSKLMKRTLLLLLSTLLFLSCYQDDFLGYIEEEETVGEFVYIFDDAFVSKDISCCQVVGYFVLNGQEIPINRRCKVVDGFIEIGTTNAIPQGVVYFSIWITIDTSDDIFQTIRGYKDVQTLDG